jgi:hypothetical protein
MKKYTLKDATKDELIQYFFTCDTFGGGYRIQADKERFLMWLQQKRAGELIDAQEASIDASQKALDEYVSYVKQANDEKDIDKKLDILDKANEAYKRYEKFNKRYDSIDKKLKDTLDL